jgi:hypothetical protein
MFPLTRRLIIACTVVALTATTLRAQFVVHDPLNYAQALARYAQLIEQLKFMVKQARRLPVDMGSRYRVPATRWRHHDVEVQYPYARPVLTALNFGDTSGALLQEVSERLDDLDEVLPAVPSELRRRLANSYATVQFADSVARMAIHQIGAIRSNGKNTLLAAENMENDAAALGDSFNTQAALLNKINAASVLELRINETTNQFLMHALEQLLVHNKRARDAEAQLMDARLFQVRYGIPYGRELFDHTRSTLDDWRQP